MKTRLMPILLSLLACTPNEQTQSPAPPAPVATQAQNPEPRRPAAAAPPPRTATETETHTETATAPAFHHVVTWKAFDDGGTPIFRVFGTRDGDVFLAAGPQIMKAARDGSVERDPGWLGGINDPESSNPDGSVYLPAWYIETLGGRWPDALFMTVHPIAGGRVAYPIEVYRFANGRWSFLRSVHHGIVRAHPRALAQWKDASVVSLRGFTAFSEPDDGILSLAEARAFKAALAKMNPLAVVRGTPKAPKLGPDLAAFDALSSGELVALAANQRAVVHLDTDGTRATTNLPDAASLDAARISITAADDVHVFDSLPGPEGEDHDRGRPYLAHFDGSPWTKEAVPDCTGGAAAFVPFPSREAWLLCSPEGPEGPWFGGGLEGLDGSGTVWHRQRGVWSQVSLPGSARGMQLVATAPDEVWVTTDDGIVYTKKPRKVIELPSLAELTLQLREQSAAVPLLSCDWGTTLLKTKPAGGHPALVAALEAIEKRFGDDTRNLELVEVDFRGEPSLALQTGFDGVPPEVARAVEQALGDNLGETRCVRREPRRVLWSASP